MRILMAELAAREQHAVLDQRRDHRLIGVAPLTRVGEHAFAGKSWCGVREGTVFVDRVGNGGIDALRLELRLVRGPHVEIFATMARRRMDEPRTDVVGDVIPAKQRDSKVVTSPAKRMRTTNAGQLVRQDFGYFLEARYFCGLHDIGSQFLREQEMVSRFGSASFRRFDDFEQSVGDPWRETDRAVVGQRPWG